MREERNFGTDELRNIRRKIYNRSFYIFQGNGTVWMAMTYIRHDAVTPVFTALPRSILTGILFMGRDVSYVEL